LSVETEPRRPIGLDLIVVLSNGTVSTSTITAHTASGGDEPFREDVSVILTVSVDEEEHKGEAELGGAMRQLRFNPEAKRAYTSRTP